MSERQIAQTGIEARQVLDNEAYKSAMESMRTQIIAQWKECPIRDMEGQRLLLQLAKLCDKFEGILRGYVESGNYAERRIQMDELRDENKLRRTLRAVTGK